MSITRVSDLLGLYMNRYRKADVFAARREGQWTCCSSDDFVRFANEISLGLLALGVRKGDKLGIMSPNRPEWNFVDFGAMQIGAVTVPLYPTMSAHDLEYVLKDAEIKVLFIGGAELYEKTNSLQDAVPGISLFSFEQVEGVRSWEDVKNMGKGKDAAAIEPIRLAQQPDDLLTLIYTSGTTGNPKGVMLTHRNIISNMLSCEPLLPESLRKALSFLPLCHIFERMVSYLYLYKGISIYYAESIESIASDIKEVQPDVFTTVPRLLEKVYDKIVAKGGDLSGIKKVLFYWALGLGLQYDPGKAGNAWYRLRLRLANRLIFSKWRAALGGNIKVIVSGGAALQPRLTRVFNAANIPVVQGYGLTETSPVIAVNFLGRGNHKLGSVGRPVEGTEVKIAPDGEILCRGENVMMGYFKRPDATASEIDEDGWFHTGDIGRLDGDGFLFITGRKKELFKTAGGKYVSPPVIENKFKESPFIEYMVVVGENRRFPAALIVPSFTFLREWCVRKEIPWSSNEEMMKHPQVLERYRQETEKFNQLFGQWEQVKRIALIPKEWSVDSGELTPKLDVKRKVVLEKHAKEIEELYEI
ncbi:long-chain acyl-CoA synthetase [Anseongella ginsenosidimutans]|uniref:Long-chain acyl-CoA synthetase n=1 Tax=Anseongella ginsenosidimutans TaxID=496056 RepID=A0A4R3KSV1_9SPHI|nr:AMP-dependent synthetase/ligase [Anseongella ginsenosidimutans]QEC52257.1 long-chain fatty acid--CoA ligase [Anseongella ginsenosidimutans]TCS86811.1 long-chain acyl-CoA synthetase [Anseongella ginsenosidimutans]